MISFAYKKILKNCIPLTNCIRKINNTHVDNAKDIDVIMPMYNLIEYDEIYLKKYYRDEPSLTIANDIIDFPSKNKNDNKNKNNNTVLYKFKEKISRQTDSDGTKIFEMVPLKETCNSYFWVTSKNHRLMFVF